MSNETFIQKRHEFQAKLQRLQAEQRAKAPPVVEVAPVKLGVYRGVYKTGERYGAQDSVTWGGSTWTARADTNDSPGHGSPDWTLSVKRGADGKDGQRGPKGDKGDTGDIGPMPRHRWDGTALQFEQGPDGNEWGKKVDLQGPPGSGSAVGGGVVVIPSFSWMPNGW